jgi:hypothetical protein
VALEAYRLFYREVSYTKSQQPKQRMAPKGGIYRRALQDPSRFRCAAKRWLCSHRTS